MTSDHNPEEVPDLESLARAQRTFNQRVAVRVSYAANKNPGQSKAQVYLSLTAHPAWFRGPVIVAGDFNSNSQWDEEGWVGDHLDG
jgi:endonuclease/exonuclease/phosphatase (EEP) superfamily protein YafD